VPEWGETAELKKGRRNGHELKKRGRMRRQERRAIEFEPAGKQPGGRGHGGRGDQFCARAGGEPGDIERDGACAGIADIAGFSEVNPKP